MEQENRFPLYKTFGKFMGKQPTVRNGLLTDIKTVAQKNGLSARFMSKSASRDCIGADKSRITVFVDDKSKKIDEITIG